MANSGRGVSIASRVSGLETMTGIGLKCLLLLALSVSFPSQAESRDQRSVQIRGPDILIVEDKEKRVYEYSQNGILRAIKVVPKIGPAYYLIPSRSARNKDPLQEDMLLLPEWKVVNF